MKYFLEEHYDEKIVCLLLISIRQHLNIHFQGAVSFLVSCFYVLEIFCDTVTQSTAYLLKGCFPLQTYRSETYRILLCPYHYFCLSLHETIKYATFRYDTAEVENGLKLS